MLQAKTNEQYRAFQNEIEFCEKEIRKFEDRILDLMAESEAVESNIRAAEASLKTEKEQVEREKRDAAYAADRKKMVVTFPALRSAASIFRCARSRLLPAGFPRAPPRPRAAPATSATHSPRTSACATGPRSSSPPPSA